MRRIHRPSPSALFYRRMHGSLTLVWAVLVIPSVLWWRDSVPWLVLMSAWANFVGHFSAWQASRAETSAEGDNQN